MKHVSIIILLGLVFCGQAQAQRYLPGQKGIQMTAYSVDGFNWRDKNNRAYSDEIAYSCYTKSKNRSVFGVEFLQKQIEYKDSSIPVSQFTASGGYFINLLSDPSKTVFFSVGASAMLGYETINWGESLLFDGAEIGAKDNFLYGGAVAFEIETFLTDRLILLLNIKERFLPSSSVNSFHFQAGIGFKCIIN